MQENRRKNRHKFPPRRNVAVFVVKIILIGEFERPDIFGEFPLILLAFHCLRVRAGVAALLLLMKIGGRKVELLQHVRQPGFLRLF